MDKKTDYSNIPPSIVSKIGRNLHNQKNHPIEIIKNRIYKYFDDLSDYKFEKFDDLLPFASIEDNFDKLLIPKDHPARNKSDTYYVNENLVLRTHTSAHQNELLTKGYKNFLVTGDVYRKDEIDSKHYPVFHQMEGIGQVPIGVDSESELRRILNGLVKHLFPGCEYRFNKDYFPFTEPSLEIEVKYRGDWLEILGCGVMHKDIVKNNELTGDFWAWGIGIDRLCMLFFDIPDIRYLWSEHSRFLDQFKEGKIIKFKSYSKLPTQYKDISFWIPKEKIIQIIEMDSGKEMEIKKWLEENDFFELVREVGRDWIAEVKLMDEFYHSKKQAHSRMYRIIYSPNDPSLKNPGMFTELINKYQNTIGKQVIEYLDVELR
jgi:phenylalanyl-tRNA synthetase alpha chain